MTTFKTLGILFSAGILSASMLLGTADGAFAAYERDSLTGQPPAQAGEALTSPRGGALSHYMLSDRCKRGTTACR